MPTALPGATIGVLGSGQLGRMFAIAARRMGYRVHTFSPDYDTPTGQVADVEVTAPYDDLDRVREFARRVDVVTFEFENVSADAAAAAAAEQAVVRPDGNVLFVCQHRVREKAFLSAGGFPVAPYRVVRSEDDLARGIRELGAPAVLKRAGFSYDGKGQARVGTVEEAVAAWASIGREEAVLEQFVGFDHEASIIVARGLDGRTAEYALCATRTRATSSTTPSSTSRTPRAGRRSRSRAPSRSGSTSWVFSASSSLSCRTALSSSTSSRLVRTTPGT